MRIGPNVQLGPSLPRSQGKGRANSAKKSAAAPKRCRNQRGGKRANVASNRAAPKDASATRTVCNEAATAAAKNRAPSFHRGSRRLRNEVVVGGKVKASVIGFPGIRAAHVARGSTREVAAAFSATLRARLRMDGRDNQYFAGDLVRDISDFSSISASNQSCISVPCGRPRLI